jgi:hypothetical protein
MKRGDLIRFAQAAGFIDAEAIVRRRHARKDANMTRDRDIDEAFDARIEPWGVNLPGCTGPCQQGRVACPCPQSCEQALDQSILRLAGQAFLAIVLAGALIAVGVALI